MLTLCADKVSLTVETGEVLTSGAKNIFTCQFLFSEDWDGLAKTAVFQNEDKRVYMALGGDGQCQIPQEVLEEAGITVYAGVYGMKDGQVVMPTVMCSLGRVRKGAELELASIGEPTPGVYEQILALAGQAEATARSVREDADAGKFIGPPGLNGKDGADGRDGRDGMNGRDGERGPQGLQGPPGEKGETGPRGTGVPEGGQAGQLLGKTAAGEAWVDPPAALPEGGEPGQLLGKTQAGDAWVDPPAALPEGGVTGQLLGKTAAGSAWVNPPKELPGGGAVGQLLGKTQAGNAWVNPPKTLPEGGTPGQILGKTQEGVAWMNPTAGQVRADWRQGDPEEKSYIRNRPFYDLGVQTVTIFEGTLEKAEDYMRVVDFVLEAGKSYILTINGEVFTDSPVAVMEREIVINCMGNSAYWGGADNGKSYALASAEEDGQKMLVAMSTETGDSLTLKIVQEVMQTVKIPERFLPEARIIRLCGPERYLRRDFEEAMAILAEGKGIVFVDGLQVCWADRTDQNSFALRYTRQPMHMVRYKLGVFDGRERYFTEDDRYSGEVGLGEFDLLSENKTVVGHVSFQKEGTIQISDMSTTRTLYPLPEVKAANNGKILGIQNGKLAWVDQESVMYSVIYEKTMTLDPVPEGRNEKSITIQPTVTLRAGQKYVVVIDSTRYFLTGEAYASNQVLLGNKKILGINVEDNMIPFILWYAFDTSGNPVSYFVYRNELAGEHKIQIIEAERAG